MPIPHFDARPTKQVRSLIDTGEFCAQIAVNVSRMMPPIPECYRLPPCDYDEIVEWVRTNCCGRVEVIPVTCNSFRALFATHRDAVFFLLRWSDHVLWSRRILSHGISSPCPISTPFMTETRTESAS